MSFNSFFRAYLECAVWASTDYPLDERDPETGEPLTDNPSPLEDLGYNVESIDVDSLAKLRQEAAEFFVDHCEEWDDDAQAGHDFWLSRNGHGAGFFDGDYGDKCDTLQTAAKVYGECNLYIIDEERIGVQ